MYIRKDNIYVTFTINDPLSYINISRYQLLQCQKIYQNGYNVRVEYAQGRQEVDVVVSRKKKGKISNLNHRCI